MISRRTFALASVIVLMIVWGTTFVVTKAAMREIPPLTLAVLRYLIAVCVLAPFMATRGRTALPRPLPLGALAGMGLTGIAIFTAGFNYALVYGSASQGALIYALVPAAVAIAAVLGLGESPSKRRVAGIVLSAGGTALVVAAGEDDRGSPSPLLGAACMLLAVAAWAWYTVIAKRLAGADQVLVITWVSLAGAVMLLPLATFELFQGPWPAPTWQGWLGTIFLGAIASAAAFIVYNQALRELDASLVGAFVTLDPIVGVATAVIFLGETLRSGQVLGGIVALTGMWLAASSKASP